MTPRGPRLPALALALSFLSLLPAAPGTAAVVGAAGQWAAVRSGDQCDATALSQLRRSDPARQAAASIVFTADRRRRGELVIRLGRETRAGASVVLTIGDQPFLLKAQGAEAWSLGAAQERAIIAAMREAGGMRVEARDRGGRRFVERFLLDGAPSAIDMAAAACLR